MSRVVFEPHEPVGSTPRKGMHTSRRARILAAHNGMCAVPQCGVTSGLEIDHIICLALGGADDDSNLEPLCQPHHKRKSVRDKALIAKAKRLSASHNGLTKPKGRIKSRPFGKQSRPFPKRSKCQ